MAEDNKISNQLIDPSRSLDSFLAEDGKKTGSVGNRNTLSIPLSPKEADNLSLDANGFYGSLQSYGAGEFLHYDVGDDGKIKIESSNDSGDLSYFDLDSKIESLKKESLEGAEGIKDPKLLESSKSEKSLILNSAITLKEKITARISPPEKTESKSPEKNQTSKKETANFVSGEKKQSEERGSQFIENREPALAKPAVTNVADFNNINEKQKSEPTKTPEPQKTANFVEKKPEVQKKPVVVSDTEKETVKKNIILQNPELEGKPDEIDKLTEERISKMSEESSEISDKSSFSVKNEPDLTENKAKQTENQKAKVENPAEKALLEPSGFFDKIKESDLFNKAKEGFKNVKESVNKDSLSSLISRKSKDKDVSSQEQPVSNKPSLADLKTEQKIQSGSSKIENVPGPKSEIKTGPLPELAQSTKPSTKSTIDQKIGQDTKKNPQADLKSSSPKNKVSTLTPSLDAKQETKKEPAKSKPFNILERNESKLSSKPKEIKSVSPESNEKVGNETDPMASLTAAVNSPSPTQGDTKSETTSKKEEVKADNKSSESSAIGSDMKDMKAFLASIAKSLKGPLTIYDPEPFRPNSRRI